MHLHEILSEATGISPKEAENRLSMILERYETEPEIGAIEGFYDDIYEEEYTEEGISSY